jgi:hypothetical protein
MVVGTPRSGTTLLQRLAIESCSLASVPETHFFSCFPRLLANAKGPSGGGTKETLRAALEEYARVDLLRGASLDVDAVLGVLDGRAIDVFDVFDVVVSVLAGGQDRLCEKTPGHLWWWEAIARARPRTKFVMMIRDPRSVVASMTQTGFAGQSLAEYTEWWRHDQRLVSSASASLGERCLVLRYEDVVGDEVGTRARLKRFCVPPTGAPSDGQPVRGAPMVLPWETWKAGFDAPVSTGRVSSWRASLSADDASYIARVTASQMEQFGYGADATALSAGRERPSLRVQRAGRRASITLYRRRQRRLLSRTVDLS